MDGIFTKTSLELNNNQIEFCIVSDIHIARDKDNRNDYVFNDKGLPLSGEAYTLKRFCDRVTYSGEQGHFYDTKHRLILLGDVINGGECGYFDCYNSYAYKLLQSTLSPWLNTGNIIYVPGNHDKTAKFYSTIAKFPRKSIVETIDYRTKKNYFYSEGGIIFEHGNKFDCLCSGKNLIGMMGDIASIAAVNLCSPDLEDLLRGRKFYIDHDYNDNSIRTTPKEDAISNMNLECKRVANGALSMLNDHPECHTIICGHTHQRPIKITLNESGRELTYINTGKFVRDGCINVISEQTKDYRWHLISII
jgi:UDP-2,3-diacylglucosamine pyrophosphatase LpxH